MNNTCVTFALDVEINDHEDWIAAGTKVKVSDNPFHHRKDGFVPVIIESAFDYDGDKVVYDPPCLEWFAESTFIETE